MRRSTKRPEQRPTSHPRPERPAGMQTMSAALYASVQRAIRQLLGERA